MEYDSSEMPSVKCWTLGFLLFEDLWTFVLDVNNLIFRISSALYIGLSLYLPYNSLGDTVKAYRVQDIMHIRLFVAL